MTMRSLRPALHALAAATFSAGVLGCGLFFDTQKLGDGDPVMDGDADAGPGSDGSPDGPPGEASAPEASNGCPSGKGPSMVRVDDFCIDSTEVTAAQYAIFTTAMGPDAGGPNLPFCRDNTSFEPSVEMGFPAPPPETPAFPVHGVDWCDAKAYCQWAGKDLCTGIGGADLAMADTTDPAKSQWAKACSMAGKKRFAYSDDYMAGRCSEGNRARSPANKTCEGGYPGIYDMVGNVSEWVDSCAPPLSASNVCTAMGGSTDSLMLASCDLAEPIEGTIKWTDIGIRCCAKAR